MSALDRCELGNDAENLAGRKRQDNAIGERDALSSATLITDSNAIGRSLEVDGATTEPNA
jgi:hypothetical protein